MTRPELWTVPDLRFRGAAEGGKHAGRGRRQTAGRVRGIGRRDPLRYPGFLEPEFLEEILPDVFGP